MALFATDKEVAESYTALRDLTIEAVGDMDLRVSPLAVLAVACAGAALEDDCDFAAAAFMLAAVPNLGAESGALAKNQELASEALAIQKRILDVGVLLTLKELALVLLTNHNQMFKLRQMYLQYRRQIGSVLTASILHATMPRLSWGEIENFLGPLNSALSEFDLITPKRWIPFLAESAEESEQLKSMRENPSSFASSASVFKGRGALQLTGKGNYRNAGKALGLDLVHHPDLVASDALVGFRAAGWFWKSTGLNERADGVHSVADFDKISNVINRGTPGKTALGTNVRRAFFQRAKDAWVAYKNRCQLALISGKPLQL